MTQHNQINKTKKFFKKLFLSLFVSKRATETEEREGLSKYSKMVTFEDQGGSLLKCCTNLCTFSINLKLLLFQNKELFEIGVLTHD